MKLFFIKVGKALSAIQNEGLIRGGRRVLMTFFLLFRRVGSGDILFVAGGVGDSSRYGCHHVAEELENQGFRCSITVQDNPLLSSYVKKFSIFIFHRTLYTPLVAKMIKKIKQEKKTVLFATDDLVFDVKFLEHMDYFKKMNALERKLYEHGVGGEIVDDPYTEYCVTTTSYLAEKLREHGKKVFLVRNKLSKQDVAWADEVVSQKPKAKSQKPKIVRIGYFSGTKSHDADFAVVAPALVRILKKYPQVKIVVAGPLEIGDAVKSFEDRIERFVFVPRREHFQNIANVDINIAPLEMGNPFCESKSELKWYEAGLVAVPTVASATGTYREAITEGVDGFTAMDEGEWFEKVSQLIENESLRTSVGEKAREMVLKKYITTISDNESYYDFLRKSISHKRTKG